MAAQPNLYSPPLNDTLVDDLSGKDGKLEMLPLLDLDLPDQYIIQNLHNRIQNSNDYWNQLNGFNLKNKRIKNLRMLRGDQIEENVLYHYQTPFKDNELYVGMDAKSAYITASVAGPQSYPAGKKPEQMEYAKHLKTYLEAHSRKFDLDAIIDAVAMDIDTQYIGLVKLEWNPDWGDKGEIIPRVVDPSHMIIDKNVRRGANPRFLGEVLKDDIEGLIARFPKKEQKIMKLMGMQRKGTKNMTSELAYREVWFTYFDKKNKPQEAVCWYINDLVLDKKKNPNWLYKGEGENFLENPMKPYIPFNVFNSGRHWIDDTSSLEQAVPVQDILNKEGRQIIDNLSTANGFRIVLAGAMTDDALENLTGDPNQSVIVKAKQGQKIDDIYKQIEPHLVSAELIQDKNQNRDVIHSILGTPSQFRGDDEDQTKTASEAQLIKNQASGRQDKVVRAINRGLGLYYQFLVQMIAVWYTDTHFITVDGGDGQFDFVEMHQDKIEKGMTVVVYDEPSGDKARDEAKAQNAAELGILAPIDYYKMMHFDDPQKLYDNFLKYKTSPQELGADISSQEQDTDAIMDFIALMAGKKVEQRDDITPQYLDTFRRQMISDEFLNPKKTNNAAKKKIIAFANDAMVRLALRTELDEASDAPLTPPPPLPPAIQATLPSQQPMMMGQPGMMPQPGMPMQPGAPAPMGQPMPQAPSAVNPAQVSGTPLPQVGMIPPTPAQAGGIQGVMQQASAPNLNPLAQPQASVDIGSLTPRQEKYMAEPTEPVVEKVPEAKEPPALKLDSRLSLSQQSGKLAKMVQNELAKDEKKEEPAADESKEEPKPAKESGVEEPAEVPAPDEDEEDEAPAPQAVGLGPIEKYILDKLPTLQARIKDGDSVKVISFKDISELPQGFELADDSARAQFTVDVAAQVDRAKNALSQYKQAELQENIRKFEAQESQDVADDIAFLQRRGILPKFQYAEDDPKFNTDPAVKEANEIYDLYKKTNQAYAQKYADTGRTYRISYRDAADKYYARESRSKANESQNAKDQPAPAKKTPVATKERQEVARQQGAPQGGEPAGNKFRPRSGMKMSDINRLVTQGRI